MKPPFSWLTPGYVERVKTTVTFDDEPTQPEAAVKIADAIKVACATCIGRRRLAWKHCAKCATPVCVMCAWSVPVKAYVGDKRPESVEMCRSCGARE